jgi:hypothetical protein
MQEDTGVPNRQRFVGEDIPLSESNYHPEVGTFSPVPRQLIPVLVADRWWISGNGRMGRTRKEIEEIIGAFAPANVITAHVFSFVKDQEEPPISECPAKLVDDNEVIDVDFSCLTSSRHRGRELHATARIAQEAPDGCKRNGLTGKPVDHVQIVPVGSVREVPKRFQCWPKPGRFPEVAARRSWAPRVSDFANQVRETSRLLTIGTRRESES